MRNYIAKQQIDENLSVESTGKIGELIFEKWFKINFEGEFLHKQKADRDFQKIDFADDKGLTYQVKSTAYKTYTFKGKVDNIELLLTSDFYVFVQIKDDYAYIEGIYSKDYILSNIKKSFMDETTCFIYAKNLLQEELKI